MRLDQFALDPKSMGGPIDRDASLDPFSLNVLFHRAPCRAELPRFLAHVDGAGAGASPPVVKHPRNVMNPVGLLNHTEKQIVILGAIEFGTKSADAPNQFGSHRDKMTEIIAGKKKFTEPVTFVSRVRLI